MQKSRKADLGLLIATGVFFLISVALFFLIPIIDNAIAANPSGVGYDGLDLYEKGFLGLFTFNFASWYYSFLFYFGSGIVALMVLWLIFILIKKRFKKLILWGIAFVIALATGAMTSGYIIATCRTVTLMNGAQLNQKVFNDLLGLYASLRVADGVAPFIFYNFIAYILGYVEVFALALVGLFMIITPLTGVACAVSKQWTVVKGKKGAEKPAEEVEELEEEEPELTAEELERRRREEELISYVEYKAGMQARQKEYEELCKAHGIAIEEPAEEELDDDEYYRITAAQLRCLHEQPVQKEPKVEEKADDDQYYKDLIKDLPVFRMSKVSQNLKMERYYQEIINELSAYEKSETHKDDELVARLKARAIQQRDYYEKLKRELPCLQYQKDPVEPKVGK